MSEAPLLCHRYAALAREMEQTETNPARKKQLIEIAEACEHVPEFPARNFHEALQSMAITGISKGIEHPMHNHPQLQPPETFFRRLPSWFGKC